MGSELVTLREILAKHGRLSVDAKGISYDTDLYQAGLTSLATVNVMLAIENQFNIEFPDAMLSRKTFASLESLAQAVGELVS